MTGGLEVCRQPSDDNERGSNDVSNGKSRWEGPQVARAAYGDSDPLLVRQRPILCHRPDRLSAIGAREGGSLIHASGTQYSCGWPGAN